MQYILPLFGVFDVVVSLRAIERYLHFDVIVFYRHYLALCMPG